VKYLLIGLMFGFGMANPATAQTVPTMHDGGWVMPVQDGNTAFVGESYEDMIYEVCATEGCAVSPETMIRVMYCESGGDHSAVGPNGELGIMQIDPRYHSEAYGSPYQQIEYAAKHLGVDVYWACLGY
jgi:Transglycosylase SLT domain